MSYDPSTNKIDNEAVLGLLGTSNSLAYKVHEIEKHFHNRAYWMGDATGNKWLNIGTGTNTIVPFSITGNATAGQWSGTLVIDSDGAALDALTADVKFDLHSVQITETDAGNSSTIFLMQFSIDNFSTILTEVSVTLYGNLDKSEKIDIVCPRSAIASPMYCRIKTNVAGQSKNIKFLVGVHTYAG